MKFTQSIRWRLLAWSAIFLTLVLGGLDFTAYQMHAARRLNQLDEELRHHVAALSVALFAPGAFLAHGNRPPEAPAGSPHSAARPPGDMESEIVPPGEPGEPPPDADSPGGAPGQPPHFSGTQAAQNQADDNGVSPDHPPVDRARLAAAARQFENQTSNALYYVIWTQELPGPYAHSPAAPPDLARPQLSAQDTGTYARTRGGWREVFHGTEHGDCLLAGASLAPVRAETWPFAGELLAGSAAVLLCGLGGLWLILGTALRPVKKISAAAREIAQGKLFERINAEETDSELGQLAAVLNSTFARLEAAFAQQKQFTADAAHELRTPIAVLISEAQTTLARERSAGDYREALAASLETAQQMRRLTDDLLQLARLDAGQEVLRCENFALDALARDCVRQIQPLAARRQLTIHCDLEGGNIFADAGRISQVITNLLANAVRYNREQGEIRVTTRQAGNCALLIVADTGPGIAAADQPHVFERFYRADKSRSTGGSGLGLSICLAIIQAHGGAIEVACPANAGAAFTVRLPTAEKRAPA